MNANAAASGKNRGAIILRSTKAMITLATRALRTGVRRGTRATSYRRPEERHGEMDCRGDNDAEEYGEIVRGDHGDERMHGREQVAPGREQINGRWDAADKARNNPGDQSRSYSISHG